MNTTAAAMMGLSPLALDVHSAARYYVELVETKHYDGLMPSKQASDLYRATVGDIVRKRMLEESEPINKAIARTTLFMLRPQPEIPKDCRDMLKAIEEKWTAVYKELIR